MSISSRKLHHFLKLAGEKLVGDWVIIGGSVIPLSGVEYRVTNDIDLCGPDTATQKETVLLMEIAEEVGLPVEAINQAGAFFLKKIVNWKKYIIPVHHGKKATFYRPNTTLYLLLKIPRLSESDLSDCLKMIELHPSEVDAAKVKKYLKSEIKLAVGERANRLKHLLSQLRDKLRLPQIQGQHP